jgi:hypothetical protein
MVLWLLGLLLFASAQIAKFPHSRDLLVAILENNDQPQLNIEAKDALLGPKGLLGADFGVPLIAALVVLLGLGACVCLAKGKKRPLSEVREGFVRLDT